MSNSMLTTVFNRILDACSLVSVVVYCIAFTVIHKNTPKHMKIFARFLLNIMIWNFFANLIFAVAHFYPLLPIVCFRLDGLIGLFFQDSEVLGHVLFGLVLLAIINVAIALFLSFQFRFMTIVCYKMVTKINSNWGYAYCILLHVALSAIGMAIYQNWTLNAVDYPGGTDERNKHNLFCFVPDGPERNIIVSVLFGFLLFILVGLVSFVGLSFHRMHKNRKIIGATTLKMQKVLLWNLIILSGIPIALGGLPFLALVAMIVFHDFHLSNEVCMVSILILVNYGSIMCITVIWIFKKYRQALLRALYRNLGKEIPTKWRCDGATNLTVVKTIAAFKAPAISCHHLTNNWIRRKQNL